MGHPKLKKRRYSKPSHPWQKERILEEAEILEEFGLKNKRELWKVASLLRKHSAQAKRLIALTTPQAEIEKTQLLSKLSSLGLIGETTRLEDVLTITLKGIMERRLQTLVHKKGLAKSVRQARQFIVHGHVSISEEKMNVPSFIVPVDLENKISFNPASKLSEEQHPERIKEASRKEKKKIEKNLDEADIFAMDKVVEKIEEEKSEKTKKVAVKKIQENVENKPPEETKKRGVKDKPAGKAK